MFLSFVVDGVGGNAGLVPAPLTRGRVRGSGSTCMDAQPEGGHIDPPLQEINYLFERNLLYIARAWLVIKYTQKPGSQW
jgi:hypothetical protein